MMISGENSDSIPNDLIIEILSRLPAKSIARFRCMSKLWASRLDRPYFTELFLTRSLARPRLLFALQGANDWCFFTSPQPHNPYGKSSLVVAADFHMKFPGHMWTDFCVPARGLIYFRHRLISQEYKDTVTVPVICNPSTGQYTRLPNGRMKKNWCRFLGFDPIDKQLKLLSMSFRLFDENEPAQILTLGSTGNFSWRKIHCPLNHSPLCEDVCINGVLYYLAFRLGVWPLVIVCFNVRSEKFKFIEQKIVLHKLPFTQLINYKGKLGGINIRYMGGTRCELELRMWVVKDMEKPEWSEDSYILWEWNRLVFDCDVSFVGVTGSGEVVFSMDKLSRPFYVFYYNPERNTLQRFEIQGFGANHEAGSRVRVFVNHVENLNFY